MEKSSRRHCVRLVPLAACLAAAVAAPRVEATSALARAPQGGNVLPVTSCADDGSVGTLRSVVASAASGDTVDMSALTCGTITLASGAIPIAIADLTLQGPSADRLSIDGAGADRVISHAAAGALTINDLSLVNGHYANGNAFGGCLYANGPTNLNRVTVSSCSIAGNGSKYGGGGIAVIGDLIVTSSTLSNNTVTSAGPSLSAGGAAFVVGNATIVDSTISGNTTQGAVGSGGYRSYGGGLVVNGALTVRNSTVAFNTAGRGGGGIFGLGYPIELDSTIVANNTAAYTGYFGADIGGYGTLSGADDLIIASDLGVPDGTLAVDPLLLPLANNGGPTATHALAPDSPAIDTGDNASSLPFDQRGDGYLRVSGVAADIGAFEFQQSFAVPTVAKNFAPDTVAVGIGSVLTITLTNANATDATLTGNLDDAFPAGITIATPTDAATDCPSGMAVGDAGASQLTLLSGAKIPAEGSCTITVTVENGTIGAFTNTIAAGALVTDQGTYPSPASATLNVTADAPSLALSFDPATVAADGTTTLTITLTNANLVAAVLDAELDDHLPPSLTVAASPNASTTCLGDVVADPGAGVVGLASGAAIPAEGSCAITVDIAPALAGVFTNTIPAGALDTSLGANADAASASLAVTTADRIFADGFDGGSLAMSLEERR